MTHEEHIQTLVARRARLRQLLRQSLAEMADLYRDELKELQMAYPPAAHPDFASMEEYAPVPNDAPILS